MALPAIQPVEGVHPLLFWVMILFGVFYLGGFLWAWRHHHFENLEFTKYKVFNDSTPEEPHPSPWTRREKEPNPVWIPVVFGLMCFWFLVVLGIYLAAQYFSF